ncbi:DUF3570 domain-containing protein [Geofilum sp. OHC36d9]|uniref:DUF3570 domain-containing protein n=1 Tax=Geofilum sp. OHC36d9 TaxID=3458413 RepID=UPI0040346C5A
MKKTIGTVILMLLATVGYTQEQIPDEANVYKKRVLETVEVDFIDSYYSQDGDNSAVGGGIGTEELIDGAGSIVISIPLNDDDILTIDGSISAYSSASSSNINPFDGDKPADPYQASSGASSSDLWSNATISYSHSSDDRNQIWSTKLSASNEFDYSSFGFGGSYAKLFNEKNTELGIHANMYLDTWHPIYPVELDGGSNKHPFNINAYTITGNANYSPSFEPFDNKGRNSYALGISFSQILSKKLQVSVALDFIQQKGLLSTPFQRVYFQDVENSYIENFQLADDIERLPDSRLKYAIGGRLHYYINQIIVVRGYYRFYTDDWGIQSNTANIELPIKITDKFTIYPSYRFYNQSGANYFAPYEQHVSTQAFYTSDYDLSKFNANQFGVGVSYTDIFTERHIWKLGLKSIDLLFNNYSRNTGFKANIISIGGKFIMY